MREYIDDKNCFIKEYEYPEDKNIMTFPQKGDPYISYTKTKKGKLKPQEYVRVNVGFDIETTTVDDYSAPYIMTIGLNQPYSNIFYVYHMRSWEDVKELFDKIAKRYIKSSKYKKQKLIGWVHNLSYEFFFMKNEGFFKIDDYSFFSKDMKKCMKAEMTNGIELRDSMALTNSSLETLSNMFTKHKKVKDLDYKKPRNTKTHLTDQELRYINEDVIILDEFSDVFYERFCTPGKRPPLTNTARLLQKIETKYDKANFPFDLVIGHQSVDDIIEEQQYLFRGGFVHGNMLYLDTVVKCLMRDITSSYPASMLMEEYPMGQWKKVDLKKDFFAYGEESTEFKKYLETKCCKMSVLFHNIRSKTDHSLESLSKVRNFVPYEDDCVDGNPVYAIDNGRIIRGEFLEVDLTEVDFKSYQLMYEWDEMAVNLMQVCKKAPLPEYLLSCVREAYKTKDELKRKKMTESMEYILSKVDVNTFFGACCKAVYEEKITFDGTTWSKEGVSFESMQEEVDNRFLAYDWGIWIAGHSRHKLVDMIIKIEAAGGHVIYYDTDSIKYIPSGDGKTEQVFEEENQKIRERKRNIKTLQDDCFYGKMGKGLGEWDIEHKNFEGKEDTVLFKTIGSKRYLYHCKDGEWKYDKKEGWIKEGVGWHLCVAGLPKAAEDKLGDDPFDEFSFQGFSFEGDDTGKLRPVYHENPYEVTIDDGEGHIETIQCKSGITLVEVDFAVSEENLYYLYAVKAFYGDERKVWDGKKKGRKSIGNH